MTTSSAATSTAGTGELHYERTLADGWARPLVLMLGGRAWPKTCLLVDVIVLYLAAGAALLASPQGVGPFGRSAAAGFPLLVAVLLRARRDLDQRLYGSAIDTVARVLATVSIAAMIALAAASVAGGTHPVDLAMRLWLFTFVYLATARTALLWVRRYALGAFRLATPTLVVGAGAVGEHLVKRLLGDSGYGLRPVGFLDADPPAGQKRFDSRCVPVLGRADDLVDAVAMTGARRIVLAFSNEPDSALVEKVRECQQLGVAVSLVPRLFETVNDRTTLDHVGGLPLLTLRPTNPRGWQFAVKHALDRAVALLGLLAFSPLMVLIALGIRMSSPGKVLFRQRRVGRDGRAFDLLKFRTMKVLEGTHEFQLPDGLAPGGVEGEDRRTRLGKWLRATSLDELPQLINVLKGDMSLVGPRPERPEFVARFASEVARYGDRHRVRSGITGWAQVNGLRGQTSITDRVEWDNYYIQNWSLSLDLRILALTLLEVVRFRAP